MAVLPPVLRPSAFSFCAFCNWVESVLEGSAAPVPEGEALLVGAAVGESGVKVRITVTTDGVSPAPVGVTVETITWVEGGADGAVKTLVSTKVGSLLVEAGGAAADDCAGGGALDWAGGGVAEVDGAGAADEAGGGAWLDWAGGSLVGAALDGAALEAGGGGSDEGAAAEGVLEAGGGLEGESAGGLDEAAGAEGSVGAGAADGVTDGEGRSDEGGSEDGAEAGGADEDNASGADEAAGADEGERMEVDNVLSVTLLDMMATMAASS